MSSAGGPAVTVEVGVLLAAWLNIAQSWVFEGSEDSKVVDKAPAWVFYVHHKPSGKKLFFDLGVNRNFDDFSPSLREFMPISQPEIPKDAVEGLAEGGISAGDIDYIVYSHLHWDHIGDCRLFPNAEVILGPGAKAATSPGWPKEDGAFMAYAMEPPSGKLRELSYEADNWTTWGPFEKVLDFFGDGSFYLVDTPGHMPGHVNGLARTGEDEYVLMGGDLCHARHFFSPCCGPNWQLASKVGPGTMKGLHGDLEAAKVSIAKVAQINKLDSVFVCVAHDRALVGVVPIFPELLNGWKERGDKARSDERARELGPAR